MKYEGENIWLEKADLIRMNQFVRNGTNYEAFLAWHHSLGIKEQSILIAELCHFAYQAGVDDELYATTSEQSELRQDSDFVALMKKVKGPGGLNYGGLAKWLCSVEGDVRLKALKWFVYLFGVAERRSMKSENRELCNHWWHRNLDDERVVNDILNDPEYFKTSPRDDTRLFPPEHKTG